MSHLLYSDGTGQSNEEYVNSERMNLHRFGIVQRLVNEYNFELELALTKIQLDKTVYERLLKNDL